MKTNQQFFQVSLKAMLQNERGETLVLACTSDGSMRGFWDFPGGRIDRGEVQLPYEQIIRREVAEEVGPEVKFSISPQPVALGRHLVPKKFHNLGYDLHILLVLFTGIYKGGKIAVSAEHTRADWVDLKNIEIEKYFTRGILDAVKNYLRA
jgi:8-oxo-dGTP diphosphatase